VVDNEIATIGAPDDAIPRMEKLCPKQREFGTLLRHVTRWADWHAGSARLS
jgi:hypothetical protein